MLPGRATGITMMPLGSSCCNSGGGMWSMPQVTMILSNGAAVRVPPPIRRASRGKVCLSNVIMY